MNFLPVSNFSYVSAYDTPGVRGSDSSSGRPWSLRKEILNYAGSELKLLDIGCGTAFKLLPLASHFEEITGLDISKDMLDTAKINISRNLISNIKLIHADSAKLPFEDCTYDVITCMLSRWNINEIFRVLKPKGIVIVEHVGCEDKKEFKVFFGKDKEGWRGQYLECPKDEFLRSFQNIFDKLFASTTIQNGFWKTYYTEQGLFELLKYTPVIRNFDPSSKDAEILKHACQVFKKSKGIELIQNRILIHAKKP